MANGRTLPAMKRRSRRAAAVCAVACFFALLVAGCSSQDVAPFEQDANRYRFAMVLSRGSGETGACAAAVSVTDLAAKRKIVIPLFTAPWGVKADAASVDTTYGARLEATVTVSADGSKGECRAALYRGETLVASREATVPVIESTRPPKIKYR